MQEGDSVSLSSISQKNFATIRSVKNTVTEVYAMPCNFDLKGTITEITYGTTVLFKMKDDEDVVYCFSLDISDLPSIKRGNTSISIDRLKVGNEVTIEIKNCEIQTIITSGAEDKLTGKVTSMTTTTNGTIWSIAADDGSKKSLMLDEGVGVYSGKKSILLSDVHVGDKVSLVLYGDIVTEVHLESAVSSSYNVSGKVLTTDKNEITILTTNDKLLYVDTSSASIVAAKTGRSLYLSSIDENSLIVAYGEYKNATVFIAQLVVVE
jgi:hypothetical protein